MFVRMQNVTGGDGDDTGVRRLSGEIWDLIAECLPFADRNALALSGSWVARTLGLNLHIRTDDFCEIAVPANATADVADVAESIPVRRFTVSVLRTPPPSHPNPLVFFNASRHESLSMVAD
jgi:hypothetical protein